MVYCYFQNCFPTTRLLRLHANIRGDPQHLFLLIRHRPHPNLRPSVESATTLFSLTCICCFIWLLEGVSFDKLTKLNIVELWTHPSRQNLFPVLIFHETSRPESGSALLTGRSKSAFNEYRY